MSQCTDGGDEVPAPTWRETESFVVIGLTRIYCNQSEEFCLVDVASQDATQAVDQLKEEGWEIEAEIPV